jgi:Mn-dependent DtxR family transcriptional regulator
MIGVSEDLANEDAEGIEHHFSTESLEKLEKFVKDLEVPELKI